MDGFSNEEEIRFGLSPLIDDQFFEGGIALRRSKTVSYVKDLSDATIPSIRMVMAYLIKRKRFLARTLHL